MAQTRNTLQRKLILELMRDNYRHPTADELYEQARKKGLHISRGTVYRNLNLLTKQNQLRRLPMPGGPDHYDCALENHYHFYCRGCDRVFDAWTPYREELDSEALALPGFVTEGHRLVLTGLCPDCKSILSEES